MKKGEHWVAIYFDKSEREEYFDSYGLPREMLGLEAYMNCFSWARCTTTKLCRAYFRLFVVTIMFI